MLTPEQISNLPTDAKKEYLRTMLLLDEKKKDEAIRDDFLTFVKYSGILFPALLTNMSIFFCLLQSIHQVFF